MKKRVIVVLLSAVLMSLLLSGCVSTVRTTLEISGDFSGQRTMVCTLDGGVGDSQMDTVEGLIVKHCPSALSYKMEKTGGKNTAAFTLDFSSREDYEKKLEVLLGRAPAVNLRRSDTIFCRGFAYSEDFTSKELLAWFDKAAVEAGIIQEGQALWSLEKPSLTLDGKTYVSRSDTLEAAETVSHPVEKIVVNTTLKSSGLFERTITVTIPKGTVDALGGSLDGYLKSLNPEGTLTETKSGKQFVIRIPETTAAELGSKTAVALDSGNGTLQYEPDGSSSTRFVEEMILTESLDFSAFLNEAGKVTVSYVFSSEAPYDFVSAKTKSAGEWTEAAGFDPNLGYSQQGETGGLEVQLTFRKQFSLTDIFIQTSKGRNQKYERILTFVFDPAKGLNGPQLLQSYLQEKEIRKTELSANEEGRHIVTAIFDGGSGEISAAMNRLFGEGNNITYALRGGFFAFVRSAEWTETLDMREFLKSAGYTGSVKYTLSSDFSDGNRAEATVGAGEPVWEMVRGEYNTAFHADTTIRLSFTESKTNVILLVIVAVLSLLALLSLLNLIAKLIQKAGEKEPGSYPKADRPPFPTEEEPYFDPLEPVIHAEYTAVDTEAETATIEIGKKKPEEENAEGERPVRRKKKNQYANAKEILTENGGFGSSRDGQSVKKHIKQEKKRSAQSDAEIPAEVSPEPSSEPPKKADPKRAEPPAAAERTCESCGSPLRKDAAFCTRCGGKTEMRGSDVKTCPVCGSTAEGDFSFCNKCGNKLGQEQ